MTKPLLQILAATFSLVILLWCSDVYALTAAEAAKEARSRTGGKVLRVKQQDDGLYRVKVLLPSGQVRTVEIGNPSSGKKGSKNKD